MRYKANTCESLFVTVAVTDDVFTVVNCEDGLIFTMPTALFKKLFEPAQPNFGSFLQVFGSGVVLSDDFTPLDVAKACTDRKAVFTSICSCELFVVYYDFVSGSFVSYDGLGVIRSIKLNEVYLGYKFLPNLTLERVLA